MGNEYDPIIAGLQVENRAAAMWNAYMGRAPHNADSDARTT